MIYCFSLDLFGSSVLFFMIYIMVGKYKQFRGSSVQHLGKKKVIWKYRLFQSALPARQDRITSFSPDDWIFSSCAFWVMDGVICGIYLALITVVAEIVIEKVLGRCGKRDHYLKGGCWIWGKITSKRLESILIGNSTLGWNYRLLVSLERRKSWFDEFLSYHKIVCGGCWVVF